MLPQNMPFWHIDYFELKWHKKQSMEEDILTLICLLKAKINLPCPYSPCTRKVKGIIVSGDRTFRDKKAAAVTLY